MKDPFLSFLFEFHRWFRQEKQLAQIIEDWMNILPINPSVSSAGILKANKHLYLIIASMHALQNYNRDRLTFEE